MPDRPAVIIADTGETRSFAEMEANADRGAHLFRELGLKRGDTIAIWLPNCLEYFDLYWAGQRAGLYMVPLSTALNAEEAAYILADSGASLLVVGSGVAAAAETLESRLPAGVTAIYTVGAPVVGRPSWSEAIAAHPATPIADEQPGLAMYYSSGTTGRQKGVRRPLDDIDATAVNPVTVAFAMRFNLTADTVYYSPAPLYHAAPLTFCTVAQRMGATAVIPLKFDAEAMLRDIERYRITFAQLVPTMFVRLLRLPPEVRAKYDLSSLTHILHGAAPCPVAVKRGIIEWLGPIVSEYYAGSEGNGSTFISSEEWLRKPGSVGRSAIATIHICGEDGQTLPPGEPGAIYFDSNSDFHYHNDPEKSRNARHPTQPGWSTLGDVGYLDEDGYLFLTDRKSFMIISGGVNIYPQEAENLLITHPRVADAAVIGVPNEDMGEEVKAVIEPLDWADAGPELAAELIAFCRAHLSHVKCPRTVDFEVLPRHETGKLYKRLIKDRYWARVAR
jgi:acyl-CoA synthetase (AMP-forming)/AMP-acid ligase II